ncbi:uncharacterized protein MAM_08457 [Metarhizium album ARSEF 1941]|uniref:Uncharacterized protein n=1 Tax=Metarhizium album (strain ARSEF 1941) TaxID=1081103 RepID=A0A0B2WJ11_METAS|nr:uncharacterized protein MAM_08457 [Metarhizium album ARSEF 1941]KHN93684.1 hypothetical protein MAM_08457 [Metarhizium album ARSEF 1941]
MKSAPLLLASLASLAFAGPIRERQNTPTNKPKKECAAEHGPGVVSTNADVTKNGTPLELAPAVDDGVTPASIKAVEEFCSYVARAGGNCNNTFEFCYGNVGHEGFTFEVLQCLKKYYPDISSPATPAQPSETATSS